jgi:hypothetical protein
MYPGRDPAKLGNALSFSVRGWKGFMFAFPKKFIATSHPQAV